MPATLVRLDRRTPVWAWVRVMFVPATTAPEWSVTVPETAPRLVCASAAMANAKAARMENSVRVAASLRDRYGRTLSTVPVPA